MSIDAAHRLMRRQHGVLSRRQALALGVTIHQIEHLCRSGRWVRAAPAVYRHAVVPAGWRTRLSTACLVTGGVASHRSAATLHGLEGFARRTPEITVAEARWKPVDRALVHRSRQWWTRDHEAVQGIPCTTLARTIVDLGAVVSRGLVEDAVDQVLRTGRLELADLYAVLVSHARRGRDGCGVLRSVLDERLPGQGIPLSRWSRLVADLLVDGGLPPPVFEYRVTAPSGALVAQVDLAYPASRVAIELDSVRWHLSRRAFERDRRRCNGLAVHGWRVLSFTWSHYAETPELLISTVRNLLTTPKSAK